MASEQQNFLRAKIAGTQSQVIKYDILTALLVMAAQGSSTQARLSLRLSLVITARYNWRLGVFAVGQKELSKMWGVTERTAKRELAQMRSLGWITVTIPSGRGRVTQHRINFDTIIAASAPLWGAVGPDYAARMVGAPEPDSAAAETNVIPLHKANPTVDSGDTTGWSQVAARLHVQDPSIYNAWFSQLSVLESCEVQITLSAPSKFVAQYVSSHFLRRIQAAFAAQDGYLRKVTITAQGAA